MMVPFRYVLAIALLRLTATVCAAPASSPESSVSNTVSPLTKDAGAHIGTGANIPSEGKQVLKDVDDVHVSSPFISFHPPYMHPTVSVC